MKVFVTGGSGFVGMEIIRQLLAAGHEVRALVHSKSATSSDPQLEIWPGDATRSETLKGALAGCEAVIHLIGIIREFPDKQVTFQRLHIDATRNILAAAGEQGIKRYLHMSSNGTRPDSVAEYHKSKWAAEELVRAAGLATTIFRPSVIFGPGDAFVNMLATIIRRTPIVPVIGDGEYQMTPVAVGNVATGFVRALTQPESSGEIYHCGGPQTLTYNELLDTIARVLGRNGITRIHQPVLMMRSLSNLLEKMSFFPITSGQLTMLLEGNVCDPQPWAQTFRIELTPFEEGIRRYLH
ncbi:MAG: NAD-dependent dehydratase [Deltaproteobacteria bacterium HGW-Deltaproteobacteria-4]|nr:MAG: NAD-dependent dehydratase [Deltaproteobacteria bacterium HGW-Deltaproteobacteria-4]